MQKNKLFLFTLLLTKTFMPASSLDPVIAVPVEEVPVVYTQAYSYERVMPTSLVTRFTYHRNFANIYLLDQSVWRVGNRYDIKEIQNWNYTDPVVLKAKNYSSYYHLYNVTRDKEVTVSFSCAPSTTSEYSFYIHSIPVNDSILTLTRADGSFFYVEIESSSMYKTKKWSLHDQIIVGWNKDNYSWSPDNPFSIMNTRTGDIVYGESIIYQ